MKISIPAITGPLGSLLSKLPAPVAGALKAVAAAVSSFVGVGLATGTFDWKAIVSAAVSALLTYLLPNHSPPAPAPKVAIAGNTITGTTGTAVTTSTTSGGASGP